MGAEGVLGLSSSPMTVRKPPSESSSGSTGCSLASTPTSTWSAPSEFWICSSQVGEFGDSGQNALRTTT